MLNNLGDGSTLSLDFTTGVLDSRLTFTRSTTGTYINSSGYVTSAAINAPRFDYDPTALAARGLLIEGSASNYGTYSESFATSGSGTLWTYSAITKNATLASSPAGNNDAAQFNETTANDIHRISQSLSAAAGSVTISVWAKAIDPATPRRLFMNAVGFMGCGALFDLDPAVQTGASGNAVNVAGSAANRAGTWVKYPNGWYRCSIVGTYNTGATVYLQVNRASSTVATDDTYAGSTTNGLMLYGFQVELGSSASSYIPTGASTGNRAADICYITNADYGFTTTGGTYFVEWDRGQYDNPNVAGADCFAFSTDYASGRWLAVFTAPAGTTTSAGSWSVAINQTSTAVAGRNRAAVSYAGWNATTTVTLSANGSSPTSNASMTLGTTPTYLMIGAASQTAPYNGSGLRDILGNTVRRLKYWPFVLPSTTMQSITVNT